MFARTIIEQRFAGNIPHLNYSGLPPLPPEDSPASGGGDGDKPERPAVTWLDLLNDFKGLLAFAASVVMAGGIICYKTNGLLDKPVIQQSEMTEHSAHVPGDKLKYQEMFELFMPSKLVRPHTNRSTNNFEANP